MRLGMGRGCNKPAEGWWGDLTWTQMEQAATKEQVSLDIVSLDIVGHQNHCLRNLRVRLKPGWQDILHECPHRRTWDLVESGANRPLGGPLPGLGWEHWTTKTGWSQVQMGDPQEQIGGRELLAWCCESQGSRWGYNWNGPRKGPSKPGGSADFSLSEDSYNLSKSQKVVLPPPTNVSTPLEPTPLPEVPGSPHCSCALQERNAGKRRQMQLLVLEVPLGKDSPPLQSWSITSTTNCREGSACERTGVEIKGCLSLVAADPASEIQEKWDLVEMSWVRGAVICKHGWSGGKSWRTPDFLPQILFSCFQEVGRPFCHYLDLGGVRFHFSFFNNETQETHKGNVEFTLFSLYKEYKEWSIECVSSYSGRKRGCHPDTQNTKLSMSLTRVWKTASGGEAEWHKYSKWPRGVLKAVFHSSPTLMGMRWSVFLRSNLEKSVAWCRGSKAESVRGNGYLFLIMISFRPW